MAESILDWKHILSRLKWNGRDFLAGNSVCAEILHGSKIFTPPLNLELPRRSYFLWWKGFCIVDDVLHDNGMLIPFTSAIRQYGLGHHYGPVWHSLSQMLQDF